jgi:hypothetical protein
MWCSFGTGPKEKSPINIGPNVADAFIDIGIRNEAAEFLWGVGSVALRTRPEVADALVEYVFETDWTAVVDLLVEVLEQDLSAETDRLEQALEETRQDTAITKELSQVEQQWRRLKGKQRAIKVARRILLDRLIERNFVPMYQFMMLVQICRLGEGMAQPPVVRALVKGMSSRIFVVRKLAVRMVESLGATAVRNNPQLVEAIRKRLNDRYRDMRIAAADMLGLMGRDAAKSEVIGALRKRLNDRKGSARCAAAIALGRMGRVAAKPEVVNALRKRLNDPEGDARGAAIRALDAIGEMG